MCAAQLIYDEKPFVMGLKVNEDEKKTYKWPVAEDQIVQPICSAQFYPSNEMILVAVFIREFKFLIWQNLWLASFAHAGIFVSQSFVTSQKNCVLSLQRLRN